MQAIRDEAALLERQREALCLASDAERVLRMIPSFGSNLPSGGPASLGLAARDSFFVDACTIARERGFSSEAFCSRAIGEFITSPRGVDFINELAEQVTPTKTKPLLVWHCCHQISSMPLLCETVRAHCRSVCLPVARL